MYAQFGILGAQRSVWYVVVGTRRAPAPGWGGGARAVAGRWERARRTSETETGPGNQVHPASPAAGLHGLGHQGKAGLSGSRRRVIPSPGRKSALSFRRTEMTRSRASTLGSRRLIPGRGDPGSRQHGGLRARGGNASPRGGSWRHRQEEACRGEGKEAGAQPPQPERHSSLSEQSSIPSNRLPSEPGTGFWGPGELQDVGIPKSTVLSPNLDYRRVVYSSS